MTTVTADRLEVEVLGAGPALVLIHGAGGSPRANFPFLDRLAEDHTVIAPHLPGSGGTPLPEGPLSTRGIAESIGEELSDRGVTQYAVLGYSMGSSIAIELADVRPASVTSLVLTAGFAKARPSLLNFVDVWEALLQGPDEPLGRALLAAILKPATLDGRGADWAEAHCGAVARGLAPGTRDHLALLRTLDVREALARTRQPLLVLTPAHDRLVDPDHSDELVRLRPDAIHVMLDAGHAVADEDGEGWIQALRWFLARARVA